jgi:hypothetical protein
MDWPRLQCLGTPLSQACHSSAGGWTGNLLLWTNRKKKEVKRQFYKQFKKKIILIL